MTDWRRQCAAVIPCYNEAGRIASVIKEVQNHLPNIIVVDDGSADSTMTVAAAAGALVLRQSSNGGKGSALRAGWEFARKQGFTWVLALDGDGQHAANDIPDFFCCSEKTKARLIVGNRMRQATAMPRLRRWANQWMSCCLSNLTGENLPDSQCGFRLVHLDTVLKMPLSAKGFIIESEMLVAFLETGERVEFVPIQVIYGQEQSKICPVMDTWRWLCWWAARRAVFG